MFYNLIMMIDMTMPCDLAIFKLIKLTAMDIALSHDKLASKPHQDVYHYMDSFST